ncbi:MAG: hypothetical protein JSW71_14945 [Gemmatimonadota bacterium]|nr:MAG: hypothetical protein JSW71_14945 [Gemmatimonadota bacterium]
MQLAGSGFGLRSLLYAGGNRALIARAVQARTPLPVKRIVRFGDCYTLYDDKGNAIGKICHPESSPRLGRNQETVLLRRD